MPVDGRTLALVTLVRTKLQDAIIRRRNNWCLNPYGLKLNSGDPIVAGNLR